MEDRLKYRIPVFKNNEFDGFVTLELGDKLRDLHGGYYGMPEQCTGLKDENGNLIYEGDILGGLWDLPIIYCKECHSFALGFPLKDNKFECSACTGDILWNEVVNDDEPLEVIGNIHNEELMKELFD